MFKQRLITSLILIPLVLCILFYAPPMVWIGLIGVMLLACGWEWLQLIPLHKTAHKIIFMMGLLLALGLNQLIPSYWLVLGLCVWVGILFAELTFPKSQNYWGYPIIVVGLAWLLLPMVFHSLVYTYLHPEGKFLFLYLLLLVWAADIGAYLAGKQWGAHKLIPFVSPGKTWEGSLGGLILGLLIAYLGYLYFKPEQKITWFILSLILILISIAGDLFISMLKRRVGLKDTGTLFPGHGGFLDRLDSLIAVSPLFYFGLTYCSLGF